jgi:Rod binding domain-containing protein
MSLDFSLSSISPLPPLDLSVGIKGGSDEARIKQVSKAMEGVFTSQLMAEMGKGIDDTDDADSKEGGDYQDFIQQAMTQGVTQGGGFGLAKVIENYLTHRNQTTTGHKPMATPTTSYHVNRVE